MLEKGAADAGTTETAQEKEWEKDGKRDRDLYGKNDRHERESRRAAVTAQRGDGGATICHRLHVILPHTARYAFEPQSRLATDIGVSRSTINRVMRGIRNPSYALAQRITDAVSVALGHRLDVSDVFSLDGTWDEPSGCALCDCDGCMPEAAYDNKGNLKAAYRLMRPGEWSLAPYADRTPVSHDRDGQPLERAFTENGGVPG